MSYLPQDRTTKAGPVEVPRSKQEPPKAGGRRSRRILLVGGVLLVLGIFAVQSLWPATSGGAGRLHDDDAQALVDQTVASFDHPMAMQTLQTIAKAEAELEAARQAAQAEVDASAQGSLAATASLEHVTDTLPPVPEVYSPGMDVSRLSGVIPLQEPFVVPELDAELTLEEYHALAWSASQSPVGEDGSFLPATNVQQLEDAKAQIEALRSQLDALAGTEDGLNLLWDTLESQGLPSGRGMGEVPGGDELEDAEDVDDPQDTVEPDGPGAKMAGDHAAQVLSLAQQRLVAFQAQLAEIERLQAELVAIVDEVAATTPALVNATHLDLQDQLVKRLAGVDETLSMARLDIAARVDRQLDIIAEAQAMVDSGLMGTAQSAAAKVQATGVAQSDVLLAEVSQVQSQADARLAEIDGATAEALAMLREMEQESGRDLSAMIALVESSAEAAKAQVTADAMKAKTMLRDASERITIRAQAHAEALIAQATDVQADLEDAIAMAEEELLRAESYARAVAAYVHERAVVNLWDLHNATRDRFTADAQAYVETTLETAWTINQDALATVQDTGSVTGAIGADVDTLVGMDVGYILEVVEDYRTVPTPDREAAAATLEALAGNLTGGVGPIADPGGLVDEITAQAFEVESLLVQVQQQLEARGAGALEV